MSVAPPSPDVLNQLAEAKESGRGRKPSQARARNEGGVCAVRNLPIRNARQGQIVEQIVEGGIAHFRLRRGEAFCICKVA